MRPCKRTQNYIRRQGSQRDFNCTIKPRHLTSSFHHRPYLRTQRVFLYTHSNKTTFINFNSKSPKYFSLPSSPYSSQLLLSRLQSLRGMPASRHARKRSAVVPKATGSGGTTTGANGARTPAATTMAASSHAFRYLKATTFGYPMNESLG